MKQLFKLQQKIDKLKQKRDKARAEVQRLRTVTVTEDPTAEYGIKEMHIDCENKDFEVGKWYKATKSIALFKGIGFVNEGYDVDGDWGLVYMSSIKQWQLATPQEIEEVLTKRCKELGLFDGEFECLTIDSEDTYLINGKAAYSVGKFAKLVEKKRILTWDDAPKNFIKIGFNGFDDCFHYSHTQLSDKSREYLSQFDNVVIE